MRASFVFVPLAVLAVFSFAQDAPKSAPKAAPKPVELTVELSASKPSDAARIGYSKARVIALETSAPRFLFEIPDFKAKDPVFFRVAMGETKGVPFYGALDRSGKNSRHDLLYIDRNRDLDLTNDGAPVAARFRTLFSTNEAIAEFLDIELQLPYEVDGKKGVEPYSCVFFFTALGKKPPLTLQIERDGWRAGTFTLKDGATYRVVLIDDDSDGQYTTSDSWALETEATPLKEMVALDATRSMLFPAWLDNQKWTLDVKSVDAGGRRIVLNMIPAKETERDFFLRIAKQRQSPEERALDVDPLRPKASARQKVDWLEGHDLKYALTIASSPNVQRPVLMFFASNTNRMSVQMDSITFRDREVATLAKRYVCSKIDAAKYMGAMKKFGIDRVPMVVFFTQKGVEISRSRAGFVKPRDLAGLMKAALR